MERRNDVIRTATIKLSKILDVSEMEAAHRVSLMYSTVMQMTVPDLFSEILFLWTISSYGLYSEFRGFRSLLSSQLFWVDFDHFGSEFYFLSQLGHLQKFA